MKIIITLLFLFSTTLLFGQNKDEKLLQAVTENDSTKVEALLNEGANSNYKKKVGFFELSMLIWAAQHNDIKIIKLLIEHKAEIDWKDAWKETALMYAAHAGNIVVVKLLIDKGADPNLKDDDGNSVLSAAKESKNDDLIKLIESLQKN